MILRGNANSFEPLVVREADALFEPIIKQSPPSPFLTIIPQRQSESRGDNSTSEVCQNLEEVGPEKPSDTPEEKKNEPGIEALKQRVAALENSIVQTKATHENEITQLREFNNQKIAGQFLEALQAAEVNIATSMEQHLAAILKPFVETRVRERILDAFAQEIRNCLMQGKLVSTTIKVPAVVRGPLAELLKTEGAHIELIAADTVEITADVDGAVLSTRFSHWSRLLLEG